MAGYDLPAFPKVFREGLLSAGTSNMHPVRCVPSKLPVLRPQSLKAVLL